MAKGLLNSPALKASMQRLDVDDLSIHSAKNGLLPNLTFSGAYTSNGLGGIFDPNRATLVGSGAGLLPLIPGGIADALGQMFGFSYPTYQAGLTLQLPIRNRAASAQMANALIQKKTDTLTVRNQQQNVRQQVLTALTALNGAKEQLKLAVIQRDFAKMNEEAAQEKYKLGTENQPERGVRPARPGDGGTQRGQRADHGAAQPAEPADADRRAAGRARDCGEIEARP